jgi:nucleotide-binding universal stress UspA family protein
LVVAWGSTLAAKRAGLDLIHAGSAEMRGLDPAAAGLAERGLDKAVAGLREMAGETLAIEGRAIWCTRTVDGLVGALDEGDYDLVVVATHGLGPVRRALVGSVAMGLAQSAPCPVLVVPDARRS